MIENGSVLNNEKVAQKEPDNVQSQKAEKEETIGNEKKENLKTEPLGPMTKELVNLNEKEATHLSTEGNSEEAIGEEWKREKKQKRISRHPRRTFRVKSTILLKSNPFFCLALKDIQAEKVKAKTANSRLTRSVNNQKSKRKVCQKRPYVKKTRGFRRSRRNDRKARRIFFKGGIQNSNTGESLVIC